MQRFTWIPNGTPTSSSVSCPFTCYRAGTLIRRFPRSQGRGGSWSPRPERGMPDAQGTLPDGGRGWKSSLNENFGWVTRGLSRVFSSKKRVRTAPILTAFRSQNRWDVVSDCRFLSLKATRIPHPCELSTRTETSMPAHRSAPQHNAAAESVRAMEALPPVLHRHAETARR